MSVPIRTPSLVAASRGEQNQNGTADLAGGVAAPVEHALAFLGEQHVALPGVDGIAARRMAPGSRAMDMRRRASMVGLSHAGVRGGEGAVQRAIALCRPLVSACKRLQFR